MVIMGRAPRIQFEGAHYHIINRGNYRHPIFAHPKTAAAFEACLFEMCGQMGWLLHAHAVMRNHFHLAEAKGAGVLLLKFRLRAYP